MGDALKYSSPKRQWSIRKYQPGDETQILELRAITLSGPKNSQWWKWQYLEHPDGPAIIYLAEAHQKIVGHCALVPVRIKIGNEISLGSCAIDGMTHPDYRQQGIFITISNSIFNSAYKNGIGIAFGTPNLQSLSVGIERLQWFEICKLPMMIKVLDWGNALRKHFGIPRFIGRLLGTAYEFIFNSKRHFKNSNIEIQQIASFDERMDNFWLKTSTIKPIMVVRDVKYLNWRYVHKPDNNYKIFAASKMNEIVGYIVMTLDRKVNLRGIIVDLLVIPGEESVSCSLVGEAIKYFEEERVTFIKCLMLRNAPYFKIFKKMGFMAVKSTIHLLVRINNQSVSKEQISNPNNWYYTYGDGDTI
jgi:hypothetical protein